MPTARDIMHSGAKCVGEDETLLDAARMMRDLEVGSLPICGNDDRLRGMVTDRDIVIRCCAEDRTPSQVRAGEFGGATPHWVEADTDVAEVLNTMERHQVRRLPVVADKRLVGIISEHDLAKNLTDEQLAHFVENVYAAR